MPMYYSQNGEDYLIDLILGQQDDGVFVEVGCIDGKRFSNTLFLEKRGWRGLCIEAHGGYIAPLQANRPNSRVIHCAIGETDEKDVIFYATERGSLSTLDKTQEARWQRDFEHYFQGFTEQSVDKRTLTSVFEEHQLREIDLLSIDIEGYEIEAVRGLDLTRYRPRVMVIESDSAYHEQQLDTLILNAGYRKSLRIKENIFYLREDLTFVPEKGAHHFRILHTEHVMVGEPGAFNEVLLEFRDDDQVLHAYPRMTKLADVDARYRLHDVGFHGDRHLLNLVDLLLTSSETFIETGTNVGSTLVYVAKHYPGIACFSCEPDPLAYHFAEENCSPYANVRHFPMTSQEFISQILDRVSTPKSKTLFWLDAHGYGFEWPLLFETEYITEHYASAYMMIDDFYVPGMECFGYDSYQGQTCSLDYIRSALNPKHEYAIYYPDYTEKTSEHHPMRGWVLIVWGTDIDAMIRQHGLKVRKQILG